MKSPSIGQLTRHLALALLVSFAGLAHGQLINVNFTGFTGGNQGPTAEDGATLEGPAGGLGTTWNQFNDEDSAGPLVDSTGAATTVEFTTDFSEGRYDGVGPTLSIYRATLTDFSRGINSRNVTITGLEAGGFYDIWLVSLRSQSFDPERLVGWWSTGNTSTSSADQSYDNRISPTLNNSTFVAGENYVLFENVEADGSGQIVFNGVAGTLLDGSDDTYRQGLNGFQIEKTTPPVVGVVTDAMSTVEASPATVFANGVLTSTVTVTLKDANGNGVPNKDVTLANTGGPQAATIDPLTALTTNGAGQVAFTVNSNTPGIEVFTATDVTDTLTLTDTASVEFIEVGVLSDADLSTVVASPTGVLADGTTTSTITVTLIDANGFPVAGKDVSLAGDSAATITPVSPQTDANGEATFTVSSTTIGVEEFSATDTTDTVPITQIVTVGFIDPNAPRTVNVNFEQFTPNVVTPETESSVEGPAGGLNTRWNQFADEDSAGPLLDSAGAPTTIEFTTNFTESRDGGGGNTPMFRSTLTDFGRGAERTLTITGLDADGYYNVWLTSFRDSAAARERTVGVWSTTNGTLTPTSQTIDNRVGRNGTTFEDGYNYVLFEFVQADGTGQIVFDGNGADTGEGFDDDYRLGLSGFQLEKTVAPLALITSFGIPGFDGVIDDTAKTIALEVPFGTDLATLAPDFTLTSGTCDQTTGLPPSPTFAAQNPGDYVVTDTSTDPDTVNTYSVTVTVGPAIGLPFAEEGR